MTAAQQTEARRHVETWRETGEVLDRLKWEELRRMTEAEAARAFTEWDYPLPSPWQAETRPEDNGLVEQQRWFMKAHAHRADAPTVRSIGSTSSASSCGKEQR